MDHATTSLTIEGKPDEKVRVVYRDRGDEPPPPLWEGVLNNQGRRTITVPQAYLVILGESGHVPLRLHETRPAADTVRLNAKIEAALAANGESVLVTDAGSGAARFELIHDDQRFPGLAVKTRIWSVAVSPDERHIATGGKDTTARLWNAETGKLVRVVTAQSGSGGTSSHTHEGGYIWSVAFSPDSRFLATGGYGGQIRLWNVRTGQKLADVGQFGATSNPPGVMIRFADNGRSILAEERLAGSRRVSTAPDVARFRLI